MVKPFHIEEIDPERFTWDCYEVDYGGRLDLDYRQSIDMKTMEWEIKKRAIGYCDGSRLYVRPKSDMYGLMLEDDASTTSWMALTGMPLNGQTSKGYLWLRLSMTISLTRCSGSWRTTLNT